MFNTKNVLLVVAVLLTFLVLTHSVTLATSFAESIAVIVNKSNPVDNLSFVELSKIFKKERTYWDGDKIYLLLREDGSKEKNILLKKLYHMSSSALKKFWMAKMFRGEISDYPKLAISANSMKVYISRAHNGIGIVLATEVNYNNDSNIKVLKIDGKLPGEAGYRLMD